MWEYSHIAFFPCSLMRRLHFRFLLLIAVLLVANLSFAIDAAALKAACAAKVERLAEKMLPQKELNEMLGFFGPVSKKYLPVFKRFNTEYLDGTNKIATVKKYLPQANAALAEAKAMKVPARYEAKKADYVAKLETFLKLVNFTARW